MTTQHTKLGKGMFVAFLMALLPFCSLLAQNSITAREWASIQHNSHYIIGSGQASSMEDARQKAMADLAGRISSNVRSRFQHVLENRTKDGEVSSEAKMNAIIQTYSAVTLDNVSEYVVKNKGEYMVYRYMKDSELKSMFWRRVRLAKKWATEAAARKDEGKIGDALQDYYWSLALLRSCPDADLETIEQETGEANMFQAVYQKVKDILGAVTVKATSVDKDDDEQRVTLEFLYGGKPVVNFNYKTCDKNGTDCGEVYTAKDGVGELLLPKNAKVGKQKVWAEYEFRDEANIHPELQAVMANTDPVPFKAAELAIDDRGCRQRDDRQVTFGNVQTEEAKPVSTVSTVSNAETQIATCRETMEAVSKGMAEKSYGMLQRYFTQQGWDMFNKLINYGNAKLLKTPSLELSAHNEYIVCRSIPMSFTFKGNRRTFTEDVVFYMNKEGLVEEVAFALEAASVNDIMRRGDWDDDARKVMIHFLETYKTAYALKRLDYISSIFSNDALIITGCIVKRVTGNREIGLRNQSYVKYTRQTKEQYMNSLKRCFASNEFINIHFADNTVRRSGQNPNVYGIQIKQDYFSSRYGDTGYLFLVIDFKDPSAPLIHVRAWQPDDDPSVVDGILTLADFTF